MSRKDSVFAAMCSLSCITFFQICLIVPSLYFGYMDEDSTCQEGTRGGLNLSDWNKGFGLEKIAVNSALYLTAILVIFLHEKFIMFGFCSVMFDFFFNIAWWIWGVVLLATPENRNCVAEGKGMAVIAIVDLILCSLWFLHLKAFSTFSG
jgi:hypothetical protein